MTSILFLHLLPSIFSHLLSVSRTYIRTCIWSPRVDNILTGLALDTATICPTPIRPIVHIHETFIHTLFSYRLPLPVPGKRILYLFSSLYTSSTYTSSIWFFIARRCSLIGMTDMVTIPQRPPRAVLPCTGHGVVLRRRETVL